MSPLLRLLALVAVGVCGCSTCPHGGTSPAPCPPSEPYPLVEAPAAEGLAAALSAMSSGPPACGRPLQILSLSGGVAGAPHTAGVLVGWSASGTRPTFDVVNGISSGSLIGAFAFLGPKYDAKVQHLILTMSGCDLFRFRPLCCIPCYGAFGSARPAERLLCKNMDDEFMADLRRAHAEGRRFFAGTMNVRTKRLVIWDVGAVASSGRPDADCLVRKILLAAVSWPGAVRPVEFDVEVNGHCYREQHCDAGSVSMAFVRLGASVGAGRPGWLAGSNLYVLANRKLYSDPGPVRRSAFCRLAVSVSTLFEALTRADIAHLYAICAATGMRFHLMAVPADFHAGPPGVGSLYPKEARQLFETGYQAGAAGPCWRLSPPGAAPGEEPIPRDATHIRPCP